MTRRAAQPPEPGIDVVALLVIGSILLLAGGAPKDQGAKSKIPGEQVAHNLSHCNSDQENCNGPRDRPRTPSAPHN